MTLTEALAMTAESALWRRYCRLAAALAAGAADRVQPAYAVGSVEWQRWQQGEQPAAEEPPLSAEATAAGRQRLGARGATAPFAGAVSPLGAASAGVFTEFVVRARGPEAGTAEIDAVEQQLLAGFVADGRAGRFQASGFYDGEQKDIEREWFGRVQLDFAGNRVVLPDGSAIAGIAVTIAPAAAPAARARERPARAMLREALFTLWQRGAFTAGTGNERVLALALRELGLSEADPPYGFKSAESVRKLRKELGMSL
jgi:hypothetical protein